MDARLERVDGAYPHQLERLSSITLPARAEHAAAVVDRPSQVVPEGVRVLRVPARQEERPALLVDLPSESAGNERAGPQVDRVHDGLVGAPDRLGRAGATGGRHVPEALQVRAVAVQNDAEVDVDD